MYCYDNVEFVNESSSTEFYQKLNGKPNGSTFLERKGYGLDLVWNRPRKRMQIIKRKDFKEGLHILIPSAKRLSDAMYSGHFATGEEDTLWAEYRNQYKWELPKAALIPVNDAHLDNGPLADDWSIAGACCLWPRADQGATAPDLYTEWTLRHCEERAGLTLEELKVNTNEELVAYQSTEVKFGSFYKEDMGLFRLECREASESDLDVWYDAADLHMPVAPTKCRMIQSAINDELVSRRKNAFKAGNSSCPGWCDYDDKKWEDREYFDHDSEDFSTYE